MSRRFLLALFLFLVCSTVGIAVQGGDPGSSVQADRAEALRLAEAALKDNDLDQGKIFVTGIQIVRESAGAPQNLAFVTHYRYEGNLGIVVGVDLDAKKVIRVEAIPNLPTSLAREESAEAERLALAHPEVAKSLARYRSLKVEIDTVVTYTVNPEAFGYNHRLVRLFFRNGRNYLLYAPNVDVDLTTGAVRVVPNDKAHK